MRRSQEQNRLGSIKFKVSCVHMHGAPKEAVYNMIFNLDIGKNMIISFGSCCGMSGYLWALVDKKRQKQCGPT